VRKVQGASQGPVGRVEPGSPAGPLIWGQLVSSPPETETWIPAFAEERHSHYREMLVRSTPQYTPRIEKTCSGVLD
jgi:hypothetical protein